MTYSWTDTMQQRPATARVLYYSLLLYQLTIAIRTVGMDRERSHAQQVEYILLINEVLHRINNHSLALQKAQTPLNEAEVWATISAVVAHHEYVYSLVGQAIVLSYEQFERLHK